MFRLLFSLLLLTATANAIGSDFAVVVSKEVAMEVIDDHKVRDIFLKKRNFGGGTRMIPINVLGAESIRKEFEARVLQMDREEINRYWISNHFQGVSPPATQASLASVKAFVINVKGAIGYLPIDMVDESLRVIHEF